MRDQTDIAIRLFYEEYLKAFSFLEEEGFTRVQVDEGLVQKLVYTRGCESIVVSLDVRDIAIACFITIGGRGLPGKFLSDLLTREEQTDAEIQALREKLRYLLSRKVYREIVLKRSESLVRELIRTEAEIYAVILRKYGRVIMARARAIAQHLYGSSVVSECGGDAGGKDSGD